MRITYLYLRDEIFQSWNSIFSHNVEKLMRWITILTHIDKFLRVELQTFPTASEKFWGEKQFCLTLPKILRVEFHFCLRMSKKIWGEIQICVIVLKNSNSDWLFRLTLPKILRVDFQFCLRLSKKIWAELQICVLVLKNSNSDWNFCLTLPKILKIDLEVCLTTSKKSIRWIAYLYLSDETFESWISIFSHNVEKLMKSVTFLTHIDKFLRVELQTFPTASEKFWGEKQFCLTVPKLWELNFTFVSECRKKYEAKYKFVS